MFKIMIAIIAAVFFGITIVSPFIVLAIKKYQKSKPGNKSLMPKNEDTPKIYLPHGEYGPIRRDYSTKWYDANPILKENEVVWDKTHKFFKVGDGKKSWNEIDEAYIRTNIDNKVLFQKGKLIDKFKK